MAIDTDQNDTDQNETGQNETGQNETGDEGGPATESGPLAVTDAAMETVLGIRADEDDAETLSLRVEITGSSASEYTYDLSFATADEVAEGHMTYMVGEMRLAIAEDSVERLRGAELDLPRASGQGGLVIRNPNTPDPFAGIDIELTGDLAGQGRTSCSSSRSTRCWPPTAASPSSSASTTTTTCT